MTMHMPARDNEVLLLILGERAGGKITVTEDEINWANARQLDGYTYKGQGATAGSVTVQLRPRQKPPA